MALLLVTLAASMLSTEPVQVEDGEGALALSWQAPAGCADAATVRRAVERRLGGLRLDRPFAASLIVEPTPTGYLIAMDVDDAGTHAHSERSIEAEDCEVVAAVAAKILAMAIDPRVASLPPTPMQHHEPDPTLSWAPSDPLRLVTGSSRSAAITTSTRLPDQASAERPRQSRLRLIGVVHAGVGAGPLPSSPSAVLGLGAGLRGRRWQALVGGQWWSPRAAPSRSNPQVRVTAQLWSLGVEGCGIAMVRSLFELPICGALEAGQMLSTAEGLERSDLASSPWAAISAGPNVVFWVRPAIAFGLSMRGQVALAR